MVGGWVPSAGGPCAPWTEIAELRPSSVQGIATWLKRNLLVSRGRACCMPEIELELDAETNVKTGFCRGKGHGAHCCFEFKWCADLQQSLYLAVKHWPPFS